MGIESDGVENKICSELLLNPFLTISRNLLIFNNKKPRL